MRQNKPRGLGHAVLMSEFVAGGRSPSPWAIQSSGRAKATTDGGLIETHLQTCAAATIAVEEVPAEDVVHYGWS